MTGALFEATLLCYQTNGKPYLHVYSFIELILIVPIEQKF